MTIFQTHHSSHCTAAIDRHYLCMYAYTFRTAVAMLQRLLCIAASAAGRTFTLCLFAYLYARWYTCSRRKTADFAGPPTRTDDGATIVRTPSGPTILDCSLQHLIQTTSTKEHGKRFADIIGKRISESKIQCSKDILYKNSKI